MWATWITLGGIIVTSVAAVLGLLKGRDNGNKLTDVRVMVDGRLSAVIARVNQLIEILKSHDINIPDDPAGNQSEGKYGPKP